MIEVAIPQGEHKNPKQLIQGGIEGGENTPLRGWKQTLYPQLKQEDADVSHSRKNQKILFHTNQKALKLTISFLPQWFLLLKVTRRRGGQPSYSILPWIKGLHSYCAPCRHGYNHIVRI